MQKKKTTIKKVFITLSIAIAILIICAFLLFTVMYSSCKLDKNKLTSLNNGVIIYSSSKEEPSICNTNRSITDISTLPKYVLDAFIDAEDKRFYSHNGFDLKRIVKASFVNLTTKSKSQGASTISQQLVKNALLSNEKTYSRKVKEIILAMKMEKQFSKNQILEMYLNTIYFGSNAYGIENASKLYFNKSASELSLNEACCLAGIIKSPSNYSPKTNYENAKKRKNTIAKSMLENGHITKEQYEEVIKSEITLAENIDFDLSYEEEAIFEACRLLNISERELINKKYQIVTHKNEDLQREVIKIHHNYISPKNLDSISIIAQNDGKVISYYVNSPYNLHEMKRQPASTLKPLAVYLPNIIHNILTPSSEILDEEINYDGFSPKNADGKFHGYVSTRYALANSLNIPAVKALEYVGLLKAKETLNSLNINLTKDDLNLSLALGSLKNGLSLNDLISAYITIANSGTYNSLSFVDKILDADGKVVYSYQEFPQKVIDENDCFLLTDMLKDSVKSGTAKRLHSLDFPIASKTGTAYNGEKNTDLYNLAYSSKHTMLSWVADIKNNGLDNKYLSSVEPTELNKQILSYLYKNSKPKDFAVPENIAKYPINMLELEQNHKIVLASEDLPERYIKYDYFKKDYPPADYQPSNDLDYNLKIDRNGVNISFSANKANEYVVLREYKNNTTTIADIKEKSGEIMLTDRDIFKYDELTYTLKDIQGNSKSYKVRPKDYLINSLNNELLLKKRKWFV